MDADANDIVVTAMAVDSCVGNSIDEFWSALVSGTSGIGSLSDLLGDAHPCRVGGQVNVDPRAFLKPTEARRTTRNHHLLLSSTLKAVEGQGLDKRTALIVGSGGSGVTSLTVEFEERLDRIATSGWRALDRLIVPRMLANMPAAYTSQHLSWNGATLTVNTACASSTDAIATACRLIRAGEASVAVAAGVEAWLTPYVLGSFCNLQAVTSRGPHEAAQACRPFDRRRDGLVPSEGAGAIVLERLDHAEAHGRVPLVKIVGWGSTSDAFHAVMPRTDGQMAANAIEASLSMAGVHSAEVDLVSAHGTSTPLNDAAESRALRQVFGKRTPVTAPKSIVGHASGACGIIECIALIQTLRTNTVTPTINFDDPDPECDINVVGNIAQPLKVTNAVKCNFGFGGQNSSLVLSAVE